MVVLNKVNNLPNFDYRGQNSLEAHKVYMTSKPSVPAPELRAQHVVVAGRDSTYTLTDGTYEDIEITFGVRTYRGELTYQATLNRLNSWLRTDFSTTFRELVFSEYPQWIFNVKVINPYTWEYFPSTGEMTAQITLRAEPFKYSPLQFDQVGNSTTPVPITPKTFKAKNDGAWRIKAEPQLQSGNDLSRFGYQRLLGNITDNQDDLNKLTEIDGSSVIVGQTKYTSGNYHNVVPDFYSALGTWSATSNSSISVVNATKATFTYSNAGTITVPMKNVQASKMYMFDLGIIAGDLSKVRLSVLAPNGANVGSSNGLSTCAFFTSTAGTYTLVIHSTTAHTITIEKPFATIENANASSYNPESASARAGVLVSVDITKLVKDIEPTIYGSSTSETDIKNILKARGLAIDIERVVSHNAGGTHRLYMIDKDSSLVSLTADGLPANQALKFTSSQSGTAFVDRLYYQNVQGSLSLWATFLVISDETFLDPNMTLQETYFTVDSFNVTVKMNSIPTAEKKLVIDGTTTAIPYLKLYKQSGATEAWVQFASYDPYGNVYISNTTVKNLGSVGANQRIDIDSQFMDVVRYQVDNPKNSIPWNINCVIDQFPVFQPGNNWITVTGVEKLEVEWRTRRV